MIEGLFHSFRRRTPLVRQSEAAECGLACLAMVAGHYGRPTNLTELRHQHDVSLKGMTLLTMISVADALGLAARPLRLEPNDLLHLTLPAILHWDMNHFVVLERISRSTIHLCDPAGGRRHLSWKAFDQHFTGVALELRPTTNFTLGKQHHRLGLHSLWSDINGIFGLATQVLFLTALLQLFVIVTPFFLQITVDKIIVNGDLKLLKSLTLGFGLVVLFQAVTSWLRGFIVISAGNQLNAQISLNVYSHLLRLPIVFFEKRHVGDILSRFSSLRAVRDFLTHRLVETVVDGFIALVTVIILFLYSPLLAIVVVSGLGLNGLVQTLLFYPTRRYSEEALIAQAEIDSHFVESLRGISTIRLFGRELSRRQTWQNGFTRVINAEARRDRLAVIQKTSERAILGLEMVIVVSLAAQGVIAGEFTVGMLFAFMAYRQQVVDSSSTLMVHIVDFHMLKLHLERLGDLVLSQPDILPPSGQGIRAMNNPLHLTLRDVGFRYGKSDSWIFQHIDLDLVPGTVTALNGQSGRGKTTLMKVMLGLLVPTEGEVSLNGSPLKEAVLVNYRQHVAAVLQDDQLFSGSIAENITFWDTQPDFERMVESARIAVVHNDIESMPMGYNSLIGDMGSVLSGGQKQRILIARALYRHPTILFLDESTSQLDLEHEQALQSNLRKIGLTQFIIAHRRSTIAGADHVWRLTPEGLIRER